MTRGSTYRAVQFLGSTSLILAVCGSCPTVSVADEAPTPASNVLASADGQQTGTRVEITKLKRNSGDTVTLSYVLVNDSDANLSTTDLLKSAEYNSSDGVTLIDAAGKKKYLVIRDSDKKCLCSSGLDGVPSKSRINLWAKFPAPPEDVKVISIAIPHFQPIDDVPISQ